MLLKARNASAAMSALVAKSRRRKKRTPSNGTGSGSVNKEPEKPEEEILLDYFHKIDYEAESRFLREKEEEDFKRDVIDKLPPLYKPLNIWLTYLLLGIPISFGMVGLAYIIILRNLNSDELVTSSDIYFFGLCIFLSFGLLSMYVLFPLPFPFCDKIFCYPRDKSQH